MNHEHDGVDINKNQKDQINKLDLPDEGQHKDTSQEFALKINQLKDGFIVHIPINDLRARDLSVHIRGHELTISGSQRIKKTMPNSNFIAYDYRRFFKTYALPFSAEGYVMRYYYKSGEIRVTFIVNKVVENYIRTEQSLTLAPKHGGIFGQIFEGLKNAGAFLRPRN